MGSEESSAASRSSPCRTGTTILAWYIISNLIILTTKWLFTNHFPFPLTVTAYSSVVTSLWAALFSRHPALRAPLPSRHQLLSYILPIGFMMALEIGCSNLALELLTVSFGTILKGGAPIFTFLFGLFLGLEHFSVRTFGCLFLIAAGIALASLGEGQEFQLVGFCLQLFATSLGGLRWAMTHKLLQEDTTASSMGDGHTVHNGTVPQSPLHQPMSPLTATLYTQPVTALCVLPFALGLEGPAAFGGHANSTEDDDYDNTDHAAHSDDHTLILATMTAIASLVFILLMSEYWLVKATSSLALSVAGTFKELLTIGGGIFFFADQIHMLNAIGFIMCQSGIFSYVFLRYEHNPAVVVVAHTASSMGNNRESEPSFVEIPMQQEENVPINTHADSSTSSNETTKRLKLCYT